MATQEYMTTQTYSATVGGIVYNVTAAVGGQMDFSTNKTFGGDVTVQGNLIADAITGPTVVTGNLTTTGDLDVQGLDISLYGAKGLIRGEGAPEGAVTAPIGCIYERSNGGTSTTIYIKESGAGNTGWIAIGGTAGWDGHTELADVAYDDLVVDANSISVVGGTAIPTAAWLTNLRVLDFQNAGGDYGYFSLQLPHAYKPGTNVLWHVHFANPANIADTETVVFRLTFSSAPIWGLFGATTTVDATFTNNATERAKIQAVAPGQLSGTTILANTHLIAGGGTITGTSFALSHVLYCRIERLNTDTHASSVYMVSADAHIEKNRLGSENEYTG